MVAPITRRWSEIDAIVTRRITRRWNYTSSVQPWLGANRLYIREGSKILYSTNFGVFFTLSDVADTIPECLEFSPKRSNIGEPKIVSKNWRRGLVAGSCSRVLGIYLKDLLMSWGKSSFGLSMLMLWMYVVQDPGTTKSYETGLSIVRPFFLAYVLVFAGQSQRFQSSARTT